VKQQRFWWKNCARKSVKKGFFYSVNVKVRGAPKARPA